jgi:tRNA(Ile)-lysidine synthase
VPSRRGFGECLLIIEGVRGGVAQLVRARGSYPRSPGFESLHRHHPSASCRSSAEGFKKHVRRTTLIRAVARALALPGAPGAGEGVVVGISGGADSTALLDALVMLAPAHGLRLVAAHLDHELRPDSALDADACSKLARDLGVDFRSDRVDVEALARERGRGIEEAGRHARYAFLRRVRQETRGAVVAVAHTRDDQVETLLLRLLRGSGGVGLAGMQVSRTDIFRPLLAVSREDVLSHLRVRGLGFREDPSNADHRFARNRIRHELLPYLEEHFNPRLREALGRTASILADEARLMVAMGRRAGPPVDLRDGGAVLRVRALRRARPALARLALRRALAQTGGLAGIGAVHVERLLALCSSKTVSGRSLCLPGDREAVFRFDELLIRIRASRPQRFTQPLEVPGEVEIPGGLRVKVSEAEAVDAPAVESDESTLLRAEPGTCLTVRSRQAGDFVRFGGKTMSLKRFLLEKRVPADLRDGLPLVASGREVLWVPGWPAGPVGTGRCVRVELVRVT